MKLIWSGIESEIAPYLGLNTKPEYFGVVINANLFLFVHGYQNVCNNDLEEVVNASMVSYCMEFDDKFMTSTDFY